MLIGIAGAAGSGKDTVAAHLSKLHKFEIVYYATELKNFCCEYLYLPRKNVWGTQADKAELSNYKWEAMPNYQLNPKYRPNCFMTYREILQHWGTEVFRRIDPDYHVNRLFIKIIPYSTIKRSYIIADTRFGNEMYAVEERGGTNLVLTRATSKDVHASENEFLTYGGKKIVLDNANMTLEETLQAAEKILRSIM